MQGTRADRRFPRPVSRGSAGNLRSPVVIARAPVLAIAPGIASDVEDENDLECGTGSGESRREGRAAEGRAGYLGRALITAAVISGISFPLTLIAPTSPTRSYLHSETTLSRAAKNFWFAFSRRMK